MSTHHVIIGGGPVATNAIETIRQFDDQCRITLVADEPAHSRMALPYWLAGKIPREHTYTANDEYLQQHHVAAKIPLRAERIDAQGKSVSLSDGSALDFDNLLIATGSSPLRLPIPGTDLPGVQPMWSLEHTQRALDAVDERKQPRVVLVGAGFIGFIVMNAMFKRGWHLSVVERESHVLPRMLDPAAATLVDNWLSSRGIQVYCGTSVKGISEGEEQCKLVELDNGSILRADLVILATGIQPNLGLLEGSGIEVDDGILVNERLQTNFPHIYAGGDVAQGPALFSDRREIHAVQPTAVDHGRVAGANMAGREVSYGGSLLMNVVDVCGLQCASYGNWSNAAAVPTTISNPQGYIYRKLLWEDDLITGAIFTGRPNDMGMLTDLGMVKGLMQTQTRLGPWRKYLEENPFDIRRAYIASGVAQKLARTTLLGVPNRGRSYQFEGKRPHAVMGPAHAAYVGTRHNGSGA